MAVDINNHEQIIGFNLSVTTGSVGFLWTREQGLVELSTSFIPDRLNDAGMIAGQCADDAQVARYPCVWHNGVTTQIEIPLDIR